MTKQKTSAPEKNKMGLVAALLGADLFALIFAEVVFSEIAWLGAIFGVIAIGLAAWLIKENLGALKSRSVAYGVNSAVTVLLVFGLLAVVNFLGVRYPGKLDLTRKKLHTLSDQTSKLMKGLNKPVKATLFANIQMREDVRPLLENYRALNPKFFEVEYVIPAKEPTRTKQAGVKKDGTVHLIVGGRDSKIEEVNEEKLTNELIKLSKEKTPTLCAVIGHGEKSFGSHEPEGYETAKKGLQGQSYEVKDINLAQEAKVPDTCDAITIIGPTKSFFDPEIKAIKDYLANGGRAVIALEINLKGQENAPELMKLLENWHIKPNLAFVVDPASRIAGVDASVPVIASFSKEHSVTRDFVAMNCGFPFTRPLEIVAGAPAGMNVQWLGQTTPYSFAVTDFKELAKGQVKMDASNKKGPFNAAVAVEGKEKDSKATRNTRMVVFGSSTFASNGFSRFGGNLDFFLNSVSWVMEDESMISIRTKDDGPGKVELSFRESKAIMLVTVFFIPALVFLGGLGFWVVRRRW